MKNRANPSASWAPPLASSTTRDADNSNTTLELEGQERIEAMERLAKTINYDSAVRIGHVHRYLCQPLHNEEQLEKSLGTASLSALKFVCLDLNRMPPDPSKGKLTKDMLVEALISWVSFVLLTLWNNSIFYS